MRYRTSSLTASGHVSGSPSSGLRLSLLDSTEPLGRPSQFMEVAATSGRAYFDEFEILPSLDCRWLPLPPNYSDPPSVAMRERYQHPRSSWSNLCSRYPPHIQLHHHFALSAGEGKLVLNATVVAQLFPCRAGCAWRMGGGEWCPRTWMAHFCRQHYSKLCC